VVDQLTDLRQGQEETPLQFLRLGVSQLAARDLPLDLPASLEPRPGLPYRFGA
jgi:hypothetical protein